MFSRLRMRFAQIAGYCIGLAVAGLLAGCSASDVLNALVPSDGYVRHEAVPYGANPRQALDVYEPKSALPAGGRTVVVFFYGGSWRDGSRNTYKFVGEALTSKGYVAVIPDYRVYPEAVYPVFVEDAARAVRWAVDNAARYGGNKDRLVLMGHSAGAHIASLIMLDPQFLTAVDLPHDVVKGFVGVAGPYSFDPLRTEVARAVFSHLADPNVARPITFVKNASAPMLLLHGSDDTTVGPQNSLNMAKALQYEGKPVTHIVYPDVAHVGIIAAMATPLRSYAPTLTDTTTFIDGLFAANAVAVNAAQ